MESKERIEQLKNTIESKLVKDYASFSMNDLYDILPEYDLDESQEEEIFDYTLAMIYKLSKDDEENKDGMEETKDFYSMIKESNQYSK